MAHKGHEEGPPPMFSDGPANEKAPEAPGLASRGQLDRSLRHTEPKLDSEISFSQILARHQPAQQMLEREVTPSA